MPAKPFIAQQIDRVDYQTLIPADYNPRQMDARTLRVLAGSLLRFGWVMPVVINRRTGNIVGGHQRAKANAEVVAKLRHKGDRRAAEYERPPAIFVDCNLATEKAMNVALNQISGDWDFFKKTAADQLRQNATYAQMRRKHLQLSRGYKAPLGLLDFDFRDESHRAVFVNTYGRNILDFGAGGRQEVGWLRNLLSVSTLAWEPWPRNGGKLSIKLARQLGNNLLDALERKWHPSTVFCNFVLSSMGSAEDREHVLTILAALGRWSQQVCIAVRTLDDVCYQQVLGRVQASSGGYLGIPDAAEPGLIVTGAGTARQKFQKFFADDEFENLLGRHFGRVRIAKLERGDSAMVGVCRYPRRIPAKKLEAAVRFEFDLKHGDTSIGLGDRAIEVFRGLYG